QLGHYDPFIWVIWVTSASKADDGELGPGNIDRAVGVILLFDTPADDKYEFFVWMLGPYRNQGIGRDPDCVQLILNQVWSDLAMARAGRPFTLLVRYPGEERAEGEEPLERDLWLSFFHYYDFHGASPEDFGRKNDITLACDSRQRDRRRRAHPLRAHRYPP